MKELSDERLVSLFAQGENKAFDVLLERHQVKLLTYINSVVQNRDLAEDIFQDTFTKVIVTIKSNRYHESGRFIGFLTRVAHNLIIDYYRRKQNDPTISNDGLEYDILNDKDLCDIPQEDRISKAQVCSDLRKLVCVLPQTQRDVIIMRYYKNLSFKEISELTGVSINTSLGRMRYALMNIKKMATEHGISLAY